MAESGILLYGYNVEQANLVRDSLSKLLDKELDLLSASGKEKKMLFEIMDEMPSEVFEDKPTKILVFLGFDDDGIQKTVQHFPVIEGLKRPIFCGLTEHNINWPFRRLMDDLTEEHNYWQKRNAKGKK